MLLKKLCLSIFLFSFFSWSQEMLVESSPQSFEEQVDHIFANVDLSEVENGILYQHGFPWVRFSSFQGLLSDAPADKLDFSLLYASLYAMALNEEARLPDPGGYRTATDDI